MEALFPFIILGAIFIFFATVSENNKKIKKQRNKERSVQKAAAKKLRIKNDKIFVGVDEGYVREKIDFNLRKAILQQEDLTCLYCGHFSWDPINEFELDHFIPVTRGGTNDITNLFPSCQPCNSEKSNNHPFDYIMFKYLRRDKITQKSLELLKGLANNSLEFKVNAANQKWWDSRSTNAELFLNFYSINRRRSGETKVTSKSETTILQDGGFTGTKQVAKDIYVASKKGKHLKITSNYYLSYIYSYLPKTSSKFLVSQVTCLAIKNNRKKSDKLLGDFFELYALDGGLIETVFLSPHHETSPSQFNFDGWNTLNEVNGGYLCDVWCTRIVERQRASYKKGANWVPASGGGFIREEIDTKLTVALPIGISF
jgi:5-methylcytosine-specific restriction endonuclease McrA